MTGLLQPMKNLLHFGIIYLLSTKSSPLTSLMKMA